MRSVAITLLLMVPTMYSLAQKDAARYNERSAEIQKEIWADTAAAFQVKKIPDSLNNESAVIIAGAYKLVNVATFWYEFQKVNFQLTSRQRIIINDKSALEDYSSIEYSKKLDYSLSSLFHSKK